MIDVYKYESLGQAMILSSAVKSFQVFRLHFQLVPLHKHSSNLGLQQMKGRR